MCEVLMFASSLHLKKPAKPKRSMTEVRRPFRLASMAISSNYCLDHIDGDRELPFLSLCSITLRSLNDISTHCGFKGLLLGVTSTVSCRLTTILDKTHEKNQGSLFL